MKTAEATREILESDEPAGALHCLRAAVQKGRALTQLDERSQLILSSLERALTEAEEAALEINRYMNSIDLDSNRLTQVQDRLALLADLRRKYGSSVEEMLQTLDQIRSEYSEIDQTGNRLSEIQKRIEELKPVLESLGRSLSKKRKAVSSTLSESVTAELKDLKMKEAVFKIELTEKAELQDWTASGANQIQFLVQTNAGEIARPLGKIVSGGELSRLMLAVRRVISDRGGIGVYLFDEIDAGIGGQTAFQVGKKLRSVAAFNQVICITHLPQVASFADHHWSVHKSVRGDRTVTEITELSPQDRREELARMLGGPELTQKSLENAAELLELAR